MHTPLHAMNIFVRAVETNSFVGAARSLLIDPAAVSRAIKALETELGVLLFARSTRALKLTAEGARFHRDCVQILKKLEQATQQFRADRAMPHGRLKVGMGLARISHRIECIGAANQRKVLCHNHFSPNRGAPRCRQSVFRICLDLNRLKDAMWWRRLTPAWSRRMPERCCSARRIAPSR